jgi:hypothetical protein
MTPRITPAIAAIIDQPGWAGTKDDVAQAVCCDQKTAWRVMTDMWLNGILYAKAWKRRKGGPVQVFARRINGEKDAPRPSARTKAEAQRERMRDPDVRERHLGATRIWRSNKKALSGEIRLGVWGL